MSGETEVVVYTQPHCGPCRMVERFLQESGVPYVTRDVTRDADALNDLTERGFMATPVTRVGTQWVAGFSRDELRRALADSEDAR
ncbi:MAG: glutaredoxin family protein [Dehalococcoidia bacterium]